MWQAEGSCMLIGLARTSTLEQEAGLEAQKKALAAAGVEKLFVEQTSSVGARPILEAAIDFAREGDELIVTDLSRLARSVHDFCRIQTRLAERRRASCPQHRPRLRYQHRQADAKRAG